MEHNRCFLNSRTIGFLPHRSLFPVLGLKTALLQAFFSTFAFAAGTGIKGTMSGVDTVGIAVD
jgi:hypothetical protein